MSSPDRPPLRLGVLVSGEGTSMVAIARAIERGELRAEIVLVASDRRACAALDRARSLGLSPESFPPAEGPPASWQLRLADRLQERGAELVVLAGFLRVLEPPFLRRFDGRIINLHPSLLPKFSGPGMYGTRVHAAVLASGDRITGASVHVVTAEVDQGPLVGQETLEVVPGETPQALSERQKPVEHRLLLRVLDGFARGTLPLPFVRPAAGAVERG